jgi:hypothetical protein
MALSIITSPPLVALTGNPVRFKLQTDNHISTAGTFASLAITFFNTGNPGDTFQLDWNDKSILFTCAATPDESGNEIPDNSVIANLNDWVEAVAGYVALNYAIDQDFTVTYLNSVLTLTANKPGSLYELGFDVTWTNGSFQPSAILSAAVDEMARPFYKLGIQLMLKVGGSWIKCGEDTCPVDASGYATFDISTRFADRVYSVFQWLESSVDLMVLRANQCMEYRIRYFEQYFTDGVQAPGKLIESSSMYILAAGISTGQQAIYNRQQSSYWAKLGYNQYFLTWAPKEKLIDRWTTEKLYYLVRSAITELNLIVEINYNDTTSQSTITKKTVANPINKGVYEIICSLNRLELSGYDQDNIDNYRVWLTDQADNRISEIRTFRMDYVYHENVREFLFKNSPGGYDTLRTTGDSEDILDFERVPISKILGDSYTELDHQVTDIRVTETKSYKGNTGWLTREQLEWVRDFLLSTQVYQIITGKLVPIKIVSAQIAPRKDREDLFAVEFEYVRSFTSEFYSQEIVAASFDLSFDDDFVNA